MSCWQTFSHGQRYFQGSRQFIKVNKTNTDFIVLLYLLSSWQKSPPLITKCSDQSKAGGPPPSLSPSCPPPLPTFFFFLNKITYKTITKNTFEIELYHVLVGTGSLETWSFREILLPMGLPRQRSPSLGISPDPLPLSPSSREHTSGVLRPQHYWLLGLDNSLTREGAILWIVGCLVSPQDSIYLLDASSTQTLPPVEATKNITRHWGKFPGGHIAQSVSLFLRQKSGACLPAFLRGLFVLWVPSDHSSLGFLFVCLFSFLFFS